MYLRTQGPLSPFQRVVSGSPSCRIFSSEDIPEAQEQIVIKDRCMYLSPLTSSVFPGIVALPLALITVNKRR
jgi:hypothetical protein